MNILDRSIQIAIREHSNQFDLGGELYILHPLRVMLNVEQYTRKWNNKLSRIAIMCAAVLHDVVEDCSPEHREKISREIFTLSEADYGISTTIYALTRQDKETWKHYIGRVENDRWATIIKIADLEDNIDITRLKKITDRDLKRNKIYSSTLKKLQKVQKENGGNK